MRTLALAILLWAGPPGQDGAEVTLQGGLQCNGMCVPDPKREDHLPVVFVVDGSPEIAARVKALLDEHFPERGLDADAAVRLQDAWIARLRIFLSPDSPAEVPDPNKGKNGHYCHASRPVTITGTGFVTGATVHFGTTAATNVKLVGNSLTATSPAGTGVQPHHPDQNAGPRVQ